MRKRQDKRKLLTDVILGTFVVQLILNGIVLFSFTRQDHSSSAPTPTCPPCPQCVRTRPEPKPCPPCECAPCDCSPRIIAKDVDFPQCIYDQDTMSANDQILLKQKIEKFWFGPFENQINPTFKTQLTLPPPVMNAPDSSHHVRAATVMLIRNRGILNALKYVLGVTFSSCTFLTKYPFYVLSNNLFEILDEDWMAINEIIDSYVEVLEIKIIDITPYWRMPRRYIEEIDFYPVATSFESFHSLNYRLMCNFHAFDIFKVPEIRALDYYMRLDDDSNLQCNGRDGIQTVGGLDVFEHMMEHELVYGYWRKALDEVYWIQYFEAFVHSYKSRYQLKWNLPVPFHFDYEGDGGEKSQRTRTASRKMAKDLLSHKTRKDVPMFFNNWEINYVPYFAGKTEEIEDGLLSDDEVTTIGVQHFNQAIKDSNGIFLYRWGDAVIRYFQLGLFVDHSKLLCLQDQRWNGVFTYGHKENPSDTANCLLDTNVEEKLAEISHNLKNMKFGGF